MTIAHRHQFLLSIGLRTTLTLHDYQQIRNILSQAIEFLTRTFLFPVKKKPNSGVAWYWGWCGCFESVTLKLFVDLYYSLSHLTGSNLSRFPEQCSRPKVPLQKLPAHPPNPNYAIVSNSRSRPGRVYG